MAADLEVLSHASRVSRSESRVLFLMPLCCSSLSRGSSLFGMCLCHDVAQSQAWACSHGIGVPALMFVLEMLCQCRVLLEGLAATQAVHVPCITLASCAVCTLIGQVHDLQWA